MSWERDYHRNGRPSRTGGNLFMGGAIEFGSTDEALGVSFADSLRSLGYQVAEGVEISGKIIRVDELVTRGLLEYGPKLPENH